MGFQQTFGAGRAGKVVIKKQKLVETTFTKTKRTCRLAGSHFVPQATG